MPIAGCERMQSKDRKSRLGDTLSTYAGAIRWGNFKTASAFAVPRSGPTLPLNSARLAGLKVTGYTIRINRINEQGDEAAVSISFTYYQEARGTVNTVNQDATWYFEEAANSWLMDDNLPTFDR